MTPIFVLAYLWDSIAFRWVAAVLVGLFALYLGLIFFAALFEKQRLRLLAPVEGRTLATGVELIAEAERHGFRKVGTFSDGDKGFREGIVSFLLSENGAELLWIMHPKLARRHQIVTRLADRTWVVTSSVKAMNDLSGLRREEMLPDASLGTMLHYHRRRVADMRGTVVPFQPGRVVDDWVAHARDRVEIMVQRGLMRYRDSGPAAGSPGSASENLMASSYTLRGALQILGGHLRDLGQTSRKLKEAESVAADSIEQWRHKN
ncbi:MAG: hypothetical protein JWN40_3158 [Phycisphaerales bacterium]|nr:hypothetical protein [Phycisphaerales bacterium]